jgi:transcriptional regulator with XRE-family HTH domain
MEKRRKNAGLSYADLAKKIGTSAAYITKVFRGDANLTIESMVKLSRATGGKVDLRIIDENIVADPSIWFASNIYHLPAANHVMVGTETVVSSKLPEIYDDYQLQKVG